MLLFMWTTSIRAWVEQVWQQSRGMLQQVLVPPASGGAVRSSPPPRRGYATDMTDAEWQLVRPLVDRPQTGPGPRRRVDLRTMRNAIWYTLRTGCQWRVLPKDVPPHQTVRSSVHRWHRRGILTMMRETLRRLVRIQVEGRHPDPVRDVSIPSASTRRGWVARNAAPTVATTVPDARGMGWWTRWACWGGRGACGQWL